jgi:hypothetical protein
MNVPIQLQSWLGTAPSPKENNILSYPSPIEIPPEFALEFNSKSVDAVI